MAFDSLAHTAYLEADGGEAQRARQPTLQRLGPGGRSSGGDLSRVQVVQRVN